MPDNLDTPYWQYKADADLVASWLANTARRCGYPDDLLKPFTKAEVGPEEGEKSKRLKGKARKLAKAAESKSTTSCSADIIHKIALGDLLILAMFIGEHTKSPIHVPENFLIAVDRVIELRRTWGAAYKNFDHTSGDKNYVICVLLRVRGALSPHLGKDDCIRSDQSPETLANSRFSELDAHEPSDKFVCIFSSTCLLTGKPDEDSDTLAMMQQEELFRLRLLFTDLNNLRQVIASTWESYSHGATDLVAASLMTNTAFDFAKHLEEDMKHAVDEHGGLDRFLRVVFMFLSSSGKREAYREHPEDPVNFELLSQEIFWPTYLSLSSFVKHLRDPLFAHTGKVNISCQTAEYLGKYDPASARSTKSAREKWEEDQQILADALLGFYTFTCGFPISAEDQLTKGLRRVFFEKQEISLSVLFALQVFLDIHHLLRKDVSRAYSDLERFATSIKVSIESMFDFYKDPILQSAANGDVLRFIRTEIIWLQSGPNHYTLDATIPLPEREPHKFLQWHPVFCGTWLYSIKMRFQTVGESIRSSGSILHACHLYNALLREELIQKQWADMDILFGLQGEDIFVDGRQNPTDDYWRVLILSRGCPPALFTKSIRQKSFNFSKKAERPLRKLAPVSFMFKDRFTQNYTKGPFTMRDIDKTIGKLQWTKLESGRWVLDPTARDGQVSNGEIVLNAEQLLYKMRDAISIESLEFSFDYLTLDRHCWELYRALQEKCWSDLRQVDGVTISKLSETDLPLIVFCILKAIKDIKAATATGKKGKNTVNDKLILQVAEILEQMIDAGAGDAVSKVLHANIPTISRFAPTSSESV